MRSTTVAMSFQSEPIVTTTKEHEPIRGGAKLTIIPCTLLLPIELVKVPIVVFSTQVEVLEKLVTPKLVPLILPNIGVGIKVTLINNVTHAFEVFKTPNTILKDTFVMERLDLQPIPLVELVDTTSEELVDDLATKVK